MLDAEGVHPYLFEPEQSSSESDEETLDITYSCEEQIGNMDWYYEGSLCAECVFIGALAIFASRCQLLESPFVVKNSTMLRIY